MATSPTPITALPTPPQRSDPTNFAARGDAFMAALPTLTTETNAVSTVNYNNAVITETKASEALNSATSALTYANAAQQSAIDAAAVAGATQWISGTTYVIGNVVWSPLTYLNYRRKTAGAGTTDPSLDTTNWALLGVPSTFPTVEISGNTNAAVSTHYIFTANLALTLPAGPSIGNEVEFTNLSGVKTCTVNPNGNKIRGNTEVMTINVLNAQARLVYTGATRGWV